MNFKMTRRDAREGREVVIAITLYGGADLVWNAQFSTKKHWDHADGLGRRPAISDIIPPNNDGCIFELKIT